MCTAHTTGAPFQLCLHFSSAPKDFPIFHSFPPINQHTPILHLDLCILIFLKISWKSIQFSRLDAKVLFLSIFFPILKLKVLVVKRKKKQNKLKSHKQKEKKFIMKLRWGENFTISRRQTAATTIRKEKKKRRNLEKIVGEKRSIFCSAFTEISENFCSHFAVKKWSQQAIQAQLSSKVCPSCWDCSLYLLELSR